MWKSLVKKVYKASTTTWKGKKNLMWSSSSSKFETLLQKYFEWTIKLVPEFSRVGQLSPSIMRNINLVPEFVRRPSKRSPPSNCSVSHAELSPSMLCCPVRVARTKPRVQGLIWLNWNVYFFSFCFSHFAPA